jgi:hypothetical protein
MMMHSSGIDFADGGPGHGAGPSASVISADASCPAQARRAPRVPAAPVTRGQGTRGREPSPSGAATPSLWEVEAARRRTARDPEHHRVDIIEVYVCRAHKKRDAGGIVREG